MTIPATAIATPLPNVDRRIQFVKEDGTISEHGSRIISAYRNNVVGANRVIPCSASGTNTITLTPNESSPLLEKYVDYEIFVFAAAETSTGSVTASVSARTGSLPTIKVYKTGGSAQAGAGDVVQNSLYLAIYNNALDSGAGGFVLK